MLESVKSGWTKSRSTSDLLGFCWCQVGLGCVMPQPSARKSCHSTHPIAVGSSKLVAHGLRVGTGAAFDAAPTLPDVSTARTT
jgi:hypothetical protein